MTNFSISTSIIMPSVFASCMFCLWACVVRPSLWVFCVCPILQSPQHQCRETTEQFKLCFQLIIAQDLDGWKEMGGTVRVIKSQFVCFMALTFKLFWRWGLVPGSWWTGNGELSCWPGWINSSALCKQPLSSCSMFTLISSSSKCSSPE